MNEYWQTLSDTVRDDFAWPVVLVSLLAIPALAVIYAIVERRKRRSAVRFGNPALMPNMVARKPGWRRHVAPLLGLLALAALLVGAARPQETTVKPRSAPTIVLAIDTSRSMAAKDVKPDRLAAAKAAARRMLTQLPSGGQVGVVSFSRTAQALTAPTEDRTLVDNALDSLTISGGTAVGDAIVESLRIAGDPGDEADGKPSTAIVLLSDGSSTEGKVGPLAAAKQAKDKGIPVYTVSLGTPAGTVVDPGTGNTIPVPPDPAALKKIAEASGGQGYAAADADQLLAIYENIGKKVGYVRTEEDLSAIFIGGALLLTLLASAGSLRWFRQLA